MLLVFVLSKGITMEAQKRDLTDQVAIVTGGNTGIGLEVALGLAREHCTVIIIARDIGKCEKAAKYIKKHSGNEAVEYRQVTSGHRMSIKHR